MNSPPPSRQGWPPPDGGGYGSGGYGQGGYGQAGHDPAYGYGQAGHDPAYGYGPNSYPQGPTAPGYPQWQQPGAYQQGYPPPAGYGPGYQPGGYGPPPPYHPPPRRRSRAWVWVLAAVAVVVVVVAVTATVVLVRRQPDITALTSAMTLPKSDFPSLPDGEFSVEPVDRNPDYEAIDVTPPECEYLVGYPRARETVSARVSSDSSIVAVYLQIDDVRPDLKSALNDCQGKKLSAENSSYEVRPLDLDGLPSWAIAETLTYDNDGSTGENSVIGGYHRGVYVEAWSSANDTDFGNRDLVDLFNAQVDRLDER